MNRSYQAGDIVLVLGNGFVGTAGYTIFTPATHVDHALIIGPYIELKNDYEILEALPSGVRTGRLSWYDGDRYVVTRVTDVEAQTKGAEAFLEASEFGRWGYDFPFYLYLVGDLFRIFTLMVFKEHRIRRVHASELPYREDHAFICTELAKAIWQIVGYDIVPSRVTSIPSALVEAIQNKVLTTVGYHNISAGPSYLVT